MIKIQSIFGLLCVCASLHAQSPTARPFQLGLTETMESKILQEKRVLNIYLPEGYSADSAALYPVIYLLDGSADEDFIHVTGLVQFCTFPWIEVLPPSIVVGIGNIDRKRDFTFPSTIEKDKAQFPTTGSSERFIAFLEKELQPFVQQHYKTSGDKMLIGQSLGGLLAVEILFKKPALFNQYLIVSPSLWWDNESLLRVKRQAISQPTRVLVAVGKEGRVMVRDAKKLYRMLRTGQDGKLSAYFEYLGKENHATIMHKALFRAFERFKKEK
jgi:predicted alpha/beta superfamily hydrolase